MAAIENSGSINAIKIGNVGTSKGSVVHTGLSAIKTVGKSIALPTAVSARNST